jgi:hypothetical protein
MQRQDKILSFGGGGEEEVDRTCRQNFALMFSIVQ